MIYADERFSDAVGDAVGAIERATGAEVVVVVAGRSGSYRDVAMLGATAVSLAMLIAVLYVPLVVPPPMVVVDLALTWPLAWWLLGGRRVTRVLTSAARRRRQVREAAEREFFVEGVHATPQRTGVLVYASALEGLVEVIGDVGIDGRMPRGALAGALGEFGHDDLDHFLAGLHALGAVLAQHVPPDPDAPRANLADAPRVRP